MEIQLQETRTYKIPTPSFLKEDCYFSDKEPPLGVPYYLHQFSLQGHQEFALNNEVHLSLTVGEANAEELLGQIVRPSLALGRWVPLYSRKKLSNKHYSRLSQLLRDDWLCEGLKRQTYMYWPTEKTAKVLAKRLNGNLLS